MRTRLLLAALLICLLPAVASAQKERPTKEQVNRYRAVKMARQIGLDAEDENAFVPLYEGFQKEMAVIMRESRQGRSAEVTTDEQAERNIQADFRTSRKVLDLRERYYAEFRKVLTPLQIRKMYAIEKQNASKE
ncbi:MAG: hypothetical protein IJT26_05205 [Bacteroidales bacterium]|nr:hypothetical protein [Bacteroidales bacterium]